MTNRDTIEAAVKKVRDSRRGKTIEMIFINEVNEFSAAQFSELRQRLIEVGVASHKVAIKWANIPRIERFIPIEPITPEQVLKIKSSFDFLNGVTINKTI